MKKVLIVISIIFCMASLYSAEPVVKFYLQDGTYKIYNIKEIENIIFSKNQQSLIGWEFKGIGFINFTTSSIDSINFITGLNNNPLIQLNFNYNWQIESYLTSIDSIIVIDISQSVKIGTQEWMSKNLDVDHYRNGDSIPEVRDSVTWSKLTTGAWCYYNNDSSLGKIYGKLYNWYAVNDSRGLAPVGWHVSSDSEWSVLSTYLGDESVAGGKMKVTGTSYWISPNTGATNVCGFSALPGGYRYSDGMFRNIGSSGIWWSATQNNDSTAWRRYMYYNTTTINRGYNNKVAGRSVRCVKD